MFSRIRYGDLNARQKENHNYHKLAALLADYGYHSMRLSDDWQGADFIAGHANGNDFLKIQIKGRLTIDKKYVGKDPHIGFLQGSVAYVYPHDHVVQAIVSRGQLANTRSWAENGVYHWPGVPIWASEILEPFHLS